MSKGITLIETIIGLAILSFGILSIAAAFPLGLKTLDLNQRSNAALFLASNKIEEIKTIKYEDLETGTFIEGFGEISDFENYKRETIVSCFRPQNDNCAEGGGIKKVKVTVNFNNQTNNQSTLTTLITNR
jgi:type II secretory pathway pseudopilin PulG